MGKKKETSLQENGKMESEMEKQTAINEGKHNPIFREQKKQQLVTHTGELFSVGEKRLSFICTIDGEKEININDNIFNVEFLNKSLNLVKVERIKNLKEA